MSPTLFLEPQQLMEWSNSSVWINIPTHVFMKGRRIIMCFVHFYKEIIINHRKREPSPRMHIISFGAEEKSHTLTTFSSILRDSLSQILSAMDSSGSTFSCFRNFHSCIIKLQKKFSPMMSKVTATFTWNKYKETLQVKSIERHEKSRAT